MATLICLLSIEIKCSVWTFNMCIDIYSSSLRSAAACSIPGCCGLLRLQWGVGCDLPHPLYHCRGHQCSRGLHQPDRHCSTVGVYLFDMSSLHLFLFTSLLTHQSFLACFGPTLNSLALILSHSQSLTQCLFTALDVFEPLCLTLPLIFRYAGVLLGITNTFATIPGVVAPIITGYLTKDVRFSFSLIIKLIHSETAFQNYSIYLI